MAVTVSNSDVVLTTSAAAIVTTGGSSQVTILKASVCNTDTAAHTVTVYRVPTGGSAATSNALINALSVPAGTTVVLSLSGQTIVAGQSLSALASVGSVVNLNISYVQTS